MEEDTSRLPASFALTRRSFLQDVRTSVEQASQVCKLYGAADRLKLWEPWHYNRLPDYMQNKAIQWLRSQRSTS